MFEIFRNQAYDFISSNAYKYHGNKGQLLEKCTQYLSARMGHHSYYAEDIALQAMAEKETLGKGLERIDLVRTTGDALFITYHIGDEYGKWVVPTSDIVRLINAHILISLPIPGQHTPLAELEKSAVLESGAA